MLGFNTNNSSSDLKKHRDKLINRVPVKYEREINLMYEWVCDPRFISANESNTKEAWQYCVKAMDNPPYLFLERKTEEANDSELMKPEYTTPVTRTPCCRLCEESLGTFGEKMKYVVLSCPCSRMYCHKKCADDYLLKEPQCYVCKNYYIYDFKNSPLKAMTVNHL